MNTFQRMLNVCKAVGNETPAATDQARMIRRENFFLLNIWAKANKYVLYIVGTEKYFFAHGSLLRKKVPLI